MRRLPGGFSVSLRHCCFALDYGQAYSRLAMLMQASFCSRSIVALTNTPSFQNDNLHKKLALLAPLAPVGLTFPTLTRQHKRPCPLCFSARAASSFQISASREKISAPHAATTPSGAKGASSASSASNASNAGKKILKAVGASRIIIVYAFIVITRGRHDP